MGRYPLKIAADNRFISFLRHIESMPSDSLVYQSLLINKELPERLNCLTHLKNIEYSTSTPSLLSRSKTVTKLALRQAYKSYWKIKLHQNPKGNFLTELNKEFCYETYLDAPIHRKQKVLTLKLRISDHDLEIENGRRMRPALPRENRICHFCESNLVETELHFLATCSLYNTLRKQFMSNIFKQIPLCEKLTDEQLFQYLFISQQEQITQDLLNYVSNIAKQRADQGKSQVPMSHV